MDVSDSDARRRKKERRRRVEKLFKQEIDKEGVIESPTNASLVYDDDAPPPKAFVLENANVVKRVEGMNSLGTSEVKHRVERAQIALDKVIKGEDYECSEDLPLHKLVVDQELKEIFSGDKQLAFELKKKVAEKLEGLRLIKKLKLDAVKNLEIMLHSEETDFVELIQKQNIDLEETFIQWHLFIKKTEESRKEETENLLKSFESFRTENLKHRKKVIGKKFDSRVTLDVDGNEKRVEWLSKKENELYALKERDEELYFQTQHDLEHDAQELDKTLENVRAAIQLNGEKLDYNYRVLSEREEENAKILNAQKRRLTKLKDSLSRNIKKYHDFNLKYLKRNLELTEDFKNLSLQQKELQVKLKHFEAVDNEYESDLRQYHWEEAESLKNEIKRIENKFTSLWGYHAAENRERENTHAGSNRSLHHNLSSGTEQLSERQATLRIEAMKEAIIRECSYLIPKSSNSATEPGRFVEISSLLGISTQEQDLLDLADVVLMDTETGLAKRIMNFLAQRKSEALDRQSQSRNTSQASQLDTRETRRKSSDDLSDLKKKLQEFLEIEEKMKRYHSKVSARDEMYKEINRLHDENERIKTEIEAKIRDPQVQSLLVPPAAAIFTTPRVETGTNTVTKN